MKFLNYIDETIYYLGQNYAFIWQNIKQDILFNGNYISNNNDFDQYLKRFGYNLKMKIKKLLVMQFLEIKKLY
jgi:surface antigen